jgi:para-nitrobenzyl esterase
MGFDLSKALGAAHGLEIAFVFGTFEGGLALDYLYPASPERDALSDAMMAYWVEFAYTGRPGRGRAGAGAEWLPWGADDKTMIVFDTPSGGGIRMSDERVSFESIRQRLREDATFADVKEKCEIYAQIFRASLFDSAEYERLGCAGYDPETLRQFF